MNLNRGLYVSKYILKKYKKEEALKELSKKQLEKVIETLNEEIQFQNVKTSGFLTFFGLILVVIFFVIPIMLTAFDSNYIRIIDDKSYQLESIELNIFEEEFERYPEGVTGTFKKYMDPIKILLPIVFSLFIYLILTFYYLSSLLRIQKLYKLLNLSRYIHSLK